MNEPASSVAAANDTDSRNEPPPLRDAPLAWLKTIRLGMLLLLLTGFAWLVMRWVVFVPYDQPDDVPVRTFVAAAIFARSCRLALLAVAAVGVALFFKRDPTFELTKPAWLRNFAIIALAVAIATEVASLALCALLSTRVTLLPMLGVFALRSNTTAIAMGVLPCLFFSRLRQLLRRTEASWGAKIDWIAVLALGNIVSIAFEAYRVLPRAVFDYQEQSFGAAAYAFLLHDYYLIACFGYPVYLTGAVLALLGWRAITSECVRARGNLPEPSTDA